MKVSFYLDALILGLLREHGTLPIIEPPQPDRANQIDAIADVLGSSDGAPEKGTLLLQALVSPEAHAAVYDAIEASDVPKTYYLEGFIKKLIKDFGALPLVEPPRRDRANQIEAFRDFPEVTRRTAA